MEFTVYYNGELVRSSEVLFSIYDHGFLFGDGVRINLRVYNRRPLMLKEHLINFFYSAEKLKLRININEKMIEKTIRVLLDLNSQSDAIVTIIATRGDAYFNFNPNLKAYPRILIMTNPAPSVNEEIRYKGAKLAVCEYRTINKSTFDRQIFTLSSQHEICNLYYALNKNCYEGLLVNIEGYVCECTRSNIFFVENGQIVTPDLESGVRNRVMRKFVMKLAKNLGYQVYEGFVQLHRLLNAEECFITGTEIEIVPVVKVDDAAIGNGVPGKLTSQLVTSLKKFTDNDTLELDYI